MKTKSNYKRIADKIRSLTTIEQLKSYDSKLNVFYDVGDINENELGRLACLITDQMIKVEDQEVEDWLNTTMQDYEINPTQTTAKVLSELNDFTAKLADGLLDNSELPTNWKILRRKYKEFLAKI